MFIMFRDVQGRSSVHVLPFTSWFWLVDLAEMGEQQKWVYNATILSPPCRQNDLQCHLAKVSKPSTDTKGVCLEYVYSLGVLVNIPFP